MMLVIIEAYVVQYGVNPQLTPGCPPCGQQYQLLQMYKPKQFQCIDIAILVVIAAFEILPKEANIYCSSYNALHHRWVSLKKDPT